MGCLSVVGFAAGRDTISSRLVNCVVGEGYMDLGTCITAFVEPWKVFGLDVRVRMETTGATSGFFLLLTTLGNAIGGPRVLFGSVETTHSRI